MVLNELRGDRLNPTIGHSRYVVLRKLRDTFRDIAASSLPTGGHCRVLDYGCGSSPYRPIFEATGAHYTTADLPGNPTAVFEVQDGGRVPSPSGSFDVVLSSQVLEHVWDARSYLGESWRLLRPGGRLILSTHGYWPYHPDPCDFHRWTGEGLRRLVQCEGFEVVRFDGVVGLTGSALQLLQDAILRRVPGMLRLFIACAMQAAVSLAVRRERSTPVPEDCLVFVVVAEKPA
ncbi:MAG: class I SAM-dependent methyltransferase [Patescibacteria group bacterium]|nr:class I SAM-dependent methyltransferase [Patescibacteria group bacterium]